MSNPRVTQQLVEAMAKHLPPSASALRLLDIGGAAGAVLSALRPDLDITRADVQDDATLPADSFDAVVAFDHTLTPPLLALAMRVMRAGGRLIVVDSHGEVSETPVTTLESAGYARILVETAAECPLPVGVLMRGEKPHTTGDTLARIQQVAQHDADAQPLEAYRGRFVHLLIQQTPNKPVWALREGESVAWRAVAVDGVLLAFSSLPKAVALMQPAILQGLIKDVNKVAKFSVATARGLGMPLTLNPTLESMAGGGLSFVSIDPALAESPDE